MLCCLKRPSAVTTEADKSKHSPKASRQPSDSSHYSPEFTPATEPRTGGTVSCPHLRLRAPAGRRTSLRRLLPRRFDAKSVGLKIPAEAGRSSLTPPQRSPAAPRSNFLVTCDKAAGRGGGGRLTGGARGVPEEEDERGGAVGDFACREDSRRPEYLDLTCSELNQ